MRFTRNCYSVRSRQRAFTLVELLVVIAIIGILVALLLPAVQAAREAARRSQCVNNLKQVALGCLNHESTYGVFPTAGGVVEQFVNAEEQAKAVYGFEGASWMYQVLPFIEEQNLQDRRLGDANGANAGFIDSGLSETPVSAFNCPSRESRFATIGTDFYALGDYAGVMASWNDPGWNGFAWQTSQGPRANEEEAVWTGILVKGGQVNRNASPPQVWKFKRVGFAQITDGSSKTILLAEKSVSADRWTVQNANPWPWWEVYGYYTGADWPHMRMFGALTQGASSSSPEVPVRGDSEPRSSSNSSVPEQGFGSAHPGVIVTAFGDGSTRIVSESADLILLDQLGKREDGTIVSTEDL